MRNFRLVSEMKKGQRSWERVLAPNSGNKANITFGPILPSVILKAVSLQLNGMLMMWKIQQAMQDDAIRTAKIHLAIHPGNRDEVWVGKTEISGTEPTCPLIWTYRNFYKGFRGEARSRKPGSYEEALRDNLSRNASFWQVGLLDVALFRISSQIP